MEVIKAFFLGLWTGLDTITIPIINCRATAFILGLILITFLLECINKILGKEDSGAKA